MKENWELFKKILIVKNEITEVKNSIHGYNSILDTTEEGINVLEYRSTENSQTKIERKIMINTGKKKYGT